MLLMLLFGLLLASALELSYIEKPAGERCADDPRFGYFRYNAFDLLSVRQGMNLMSREVLHGVERRTEPNRKLCISVRVRRLFSRFGPRGYGSFRGYRTEVSSVAVSYGVLKLI